MKNINFYSACSKIDKTKVLLIPIVWRCLRCRSSSTTISLKTDHIDKRYKNDHFSTYYQTITTVFSWVCVCMEKYTLPMFCLYHSALICFWIARCRQLKRVRNYGHGQHRARFSNVPITIWQLVSTHVLHVSNIIFQLLALCTRDIYVTSGELCGRLETAKKYKYLLQDEHRPSWSP